MTGRQWAIGAAAGLVVVAGGVVAVDRLRPHCGEDVTEVAADDSRSPFLGAADRAEQPDRDRDTLVRTLARDPAPIGPVVGAVGYHYEQWAQVSAYAQGIGVRTRDNPDFTMLDDRTLRPRWSVAVATGRSAYDAGEKTYLVTTMPRTGPPDLVALDAGTGERRWCTPVGERHVGAQDAYATAVLDDGSVAVLSPATGGRERLARVNADGSPSWQRTLDADDGDFLGDLGKGRLLVGGRAQYDLYDPAALARREAGVSLAAVSARDGRTLWRAEETAGSDVHVVGTDPATGTTVLLEQRLPARTVRLKALDRDGNQRWFAVPARGAAFDATVRAGRVLVRAGNRWSAYALADGHRLWSRTVPARPQFVPYGFQLDGVPLLDADHALVGGTTALHTLDLDTGEMTSAALPTDGVGTTYWPYQLAVSDRLVAVATNTGAVVVRRE